MGMSQREQNELVAERQKLLDRIRDLEAARPPVGSLACKIGEKGGLSVYGLQRFPITLYAEQWERLIENIPAIKAFMLANSSQLTRKPKFGPAETAVVAPTGPTPETSAALAVANRILGSDTPTA